MNLVNRIVLIVLCLALIGAALSVIVLAWTAAGDSIDGLRDAVDWLGDHNDDLEKALLTLIAALVGLLALIVVLAELLPQAGADVKITDLQVGDAVLSTGAIGQRVEEAVGQVPHVVQAKATVRPKRRGVKVRLDLQVAPEANLATVTDEACEAARYVLLNRVHVALAEPPSARIHYRELRLQRATQARARRVPVAAPAPAAAAPEAASSEEQPVATEAAAAEAAEKPADEEDAASEERKPE